MKMEENVEGLNEWDDITVNSSGFFSGLGDDHVDSDMFSCGAGNLDGNDHVNDVENSRFDVENSSTLDGCGSDEVNRLSKIEGSLAERRARKCGFNADKISTPRFRSSSSLPSPAGCSSFLAIPAGISPHLLLDSPILLPNSQLSPTTGTFIKPSFDGDDQMMIPSLPTHANYSGDGGLSSMFTSHAGSTSLASFDDAQNQQPVDFEFPMGMSEEAGMNNHSVSQPLDGKFSNDLILNSNSSTLLPNGTNVSGSVQMSVKNETFIQDDSGTHSALQGGQKESYFTMGSARTTEDGYNWRKYGQKQVKGSEYPRSYYKCTHPSCQVKKKVERSHDGQITEIIYKNSHNHPKPQPCRKSPFGASSFNNASDSGNGSSCYAKAEGGTAWTQLDVMIGSDRQIDGLEKPSSASVVTEISDLPSITEKTPLGVLEPTGTPELSSTLGNYDDDEEDAATQGSFLPPDDDEKEPDLKRRNTETTIGSRAVRAPRVVVQIESEIDILDDGYRWRKYGQKVVKGNPNPRSYYKCTSPGCNVRKHVERASHNLKFVITTYEGKHNHEVPAARNSSHGNSGCGPSPTIGSNTHPNLQLSRNPHHPNPELHSQDLPPPFDARMGCNNDFIRSNFVGAGTPPIYQMKYRTLPNTSPYNPFSFSGHHPAYTSGSMTAAPELSMPMSVGFPNYSNPERMVSSVQGYSGQQMEDTDVKPIRPKQEQKDESVYSTAMSNFHHPDSSSSMYNIMGNFPS